jgi:hypothetical protein
MKFFVLSVTITIVLMIISTAKKLRITVLLFVMSKNQFLRIAFEYDHKSLF